MMLRSAALLLLAAPLAQGFAVAPPRAMVQPVLFAVDDGKVDEVDDEMFGFDDSIEQVYDDFEDQVEDFVTPDDKFAKAKETASSAFADAKTKVEDFANDERVKEIAGKAQDFAKDVMGQLFGKVGDKLKEIKKEKEEREKQDV